MPPISAPKMRTSPSRTPPIFFTLSKNHGKTGVLLLGNTAAVTIMIASLIILVALAVTTIHSIDSLSLTLSHLK